MIAFTLPFIFVLTVCESIGKQEWLASMNGAALPWSGVVCYTAAICHNGDRLKQHLCNLLDWVAHLVKLIGVVFHLLPTKVRLCTISPPQKVENR
jgi:hypothetical protein